MNKKDLLVETERGTILHLLLKPNSRKQALEFDLASKTVTIHVKSPPEKGKANRELLKFLAKYFEKPANEIELIAGHTSRDKAVFFHNTNKNTIRTKLKK